MLYFQTSALAAGNVGPNVIAPHRTFASVASSRLTGTLMQTASTSSRLVSGEKMQA